MPGDGLEWVAARNVAKESQSSISYHIYESDRQSGTLTVSDVTNFEVRYVV